MRGEVGVVVGEGCGWVMEAKRSGPSAVGEISDCNWGSQVGSLWSAIGVRARLTCSQIDALEEYAPWLQVPLSSSLAWHRYGPEHSLAEVCDIQWNTRMQIH